MIILRQTYDKTYDKYTNKQNNIEYLSVCNDVSHWLVINRNKIVIKSEDIVRSLFVIYL